MIKIVLLFALVASAAALQDAAPEAGPEPYSYAYQTDSHGAAEQRDPAGRVTGYYTLADADGRERRVEYVADENGFRAKVQTNEMGTKAESPANVEVQAAEPSPAQYAAAAQYSAAGSAQYSAGTAAQYSAANAAAAAQAARGAQYTRQTYTTTAAGAAPFAANYAANYQQYAYRPYGVSSYYSNGAYPSSYNSAYGGYGGYGGYGTANYYAGGYPFGASYYSGYSGAPAGYYGYSSNYGPASQYYSYRSSTSGSAPAPAAAYTTYGSASGYRYAPQPVGGVTTTTYRQVAGVAPAAGVTTYSTGFPTANFGANGATGGSSSSSSRSFQGSSNYIVLKKRDAEKKREEAATSS